MKVFCGIEGGATLSKIVLINQNGDVIASTEGPATNVWLLGIDECQKRLNDLILKAKTDAGLNCEIVLDGLGLCLSGCEDEERNRSFEEEFMLKYPSLTKSCTVASDTMGPLYSVSPKGGVVLIAGTGSNALLINPDGSTGRCGGWGHLIGDEASAYWISMKAVKAVFDDEDNLVKCPHSTERVKKMIFQYFEMSDLFGILEHCYTHFNKSKFSGLCAKLAVAASDEKDQLCCLLFREAGEALAKMLIALKPRVHPDLLMGERGLPVVCVGSVFKSWHLMRDGFLNAIEGHFAKFTLIQPSGSSVMGAAYLGAKSNGFELPMKCGKNLEILYCHDTE